MKKLYEINKWLIITTLLLYLTIYLGMLFQMVLGVAQVIMSIYILTNYNNLKRETKSLFTVYLVLTVIVVSIIASGMITSSGFIIVHLIIPMLIAFFHLYITYRIKES